MSKVNSVFSYKRWFWLQCSQPIYSLNRYFCLFVFPSWHPSPISLNFTLNFRLKSLTCSAGCLMKHLEFLFPVTSYCPACNTWSKGSDLLCLVGVRSTGAGVGWPRGHITDLATIPLLEPPFHPWLGISEKSPIPWKLHICPHHFLYWICFWKSLKVHFLHECSASGRGSEFAFFI